MKILIIEDEELAAKRLKLLIHELEPEAAISGPLDTVDASVAHLKTNPHYDLIFLDVQLADGKCFSIFSECDVAIPVIFTTAYDEYALKAFDLNSVDYLLKPVNRDKLKQAIDKFHRLKDYFKTENPENSILEWVKKLNIPNKQLYKERFLISKSDTFFTINTSEVACFYAEEKEVFLLTLNNKRHIIPHTIDDLCAKLDPRQFFRVNRQYIVASAAIRKVHHFFNFKLKVELTVDPTREIIVSRARTAAFKSWLNGEDVNGLQQSGW
jgi:DNA-binding LytR/AlgR family response regulator